MGKGGSRHKDSSIMNVSGGRASGRVQQGPGPGEVGHGIEPGRLEVVLVKAGPQARLGAY